MKSCDNCKHSITYFIDIDGSGRRDYPEEDCDYNGECCEENDHAGWEARE